MRILFYSLTIIILLLNTPALAGDEGAHKTVIANADHAITAQINGLVCDFCARALEKVFAKRDEVSGIDVNLDTKLVTIGFKKGGNIDDATITKLITDAGYNVVKINR